MLIQALYTAVAHESKKEREVEEKLVGQRQISSQIWRESKNRNCAVESRASAQTGTGIGYDYDYDTQWRSNANKYITVVTHQMQARKRILVLGISDILSRSLAHLTASQSG